MSSINDEFVGLRVHLNKICNKLQEREMNTHYDLENAVNKILSAAISTCYTVIAQTNHTVNDCHDKIEKIRNESEI